MCSMENNKSPGIDGLTTNFYKYFWPILSEKLRRVYNHAFRTGALAVSQRQGITSLLGSLSKRAFETRTDTGREHFARQDSGVSQIFYKNHL